MATSALLVPVFVAGNRLIWGSKFLRISFFVVLYASVLAALFSAFARYRNDQQSSRPMASGAVYHGSESFTRALSASCRYVAHRF
jgi:hypothetical protein